MKKIIATLLVTAAMSSQVSAQPAPVVGAGALGFSTTALILTGTFFVAAIASVHSANNHK